MCFFFTHLPLLRGGKKQAESRTGMWRNLTRGNKTMRAERCVPTAAGEKKARVLQLCHKFTQQNKKSGMVWLLVLNYHHLKDGGWSHKWRITEWQCWLHYAPVKGWTFFLVLFAEFVVCALTFTQVVLSRWFLLLCSLDGDTQQSAAVADIATTFLSAIFIGTLSHWTGETILKSICSLTDPVSNKAGLKCSPVEGVLSFLKALLLQHLLTIRSNISKVFIVFCAVNQPSLNTLWHHKNVFTASHVILNM